MSESDSSASLDSNGIVKCSTPPKSLSKYINKNIRIASDDSSDSSASNDSDLFDDDKSSSRSSSPVRSAIEFNQFQHYDKSDDENEKYRTEIAHTQEITLKIQYCLWNIRNFSSCKLNKEGYINSKIYSAGVSNDLLWYFRIERLKQDNEVFYAVYAHTLTYEQSEAALEFRAYIVELTGHSYRLALSKKFPKKEGFKFLGYLRKSHIRDDEYWYHRMIPEDELTLSFRVHVQFKTYKNKLADDFKSLWINKQFTDFNLLVKDHVFPTHKTILAARSSVFADMFAMKNNLKEHEMNDFEPEMVEQLLRYFYTGRIKKLIKFLRQFSIAADKYKLTELKAICEKAMESYS